MAAFAHLLLQECDMIAAPKRITPTSNTGKPKAAYVYKLLGTDGYEPFAPVARDYAIVRRDEHGIRDKRLLTQARPVGEHYLALATDRRGVPITRATVDGEPVDLIWWKGPRTDHACTRCTIADGKARNVVLMTRHARVRGNNRVPTLQDAGTWHPDCLAAKLLRSQFGQDVRQHATPVE
jgi:hypothetical protein